MYVALFVKNVREAIRKQSHCKIVGEKETVVFDLSSFLHVGDFESEIPKNYCAVRTIVNYI